MISFLTKPFKDFHRIVTDDTPEKIKRELEDDRDRVKKFLQTFDPEETLYCTQRKKQCESCGLLIWEKDKDHRYTKINETHIKTFYGLEIDDKKKIIGNTAAENIERIRQSGREHTFGELCVSTDALVAEAMQPMRFFELGYIDGKLLILDVHKVPIVIGGEFFGTKGNALNLSHRETEIYDLLQYYMTKRIAKRLDKNSHRRDVAAYLIQNENKNVFGRDFPG